MILFILFECEKRTNKNEKDNLLKYHTLLIDLCVMCINAECVSDPNCKSPLDSVEYV